MHSHHLRRRFLEKIGVMHPLGPDGKIGFATDFRRLNDTRPGYGYAGVPDPNKEVLAPENAITSQPTVACRLAISFLR